VTKDLPVFNRAKSKGIEKQLDRLKSVELSLDEYKKLAVICKEIGIDFGCTIFDKFILDQLDEFLSYRKISSGEIHNYETLKLHKNNKKPVIISTGLVRDLKDIVLALDVLSDSEVFIMHCVSSYPVNSKNSNINNIKKLMDLFPKHRIGYSDHTVGIESASLALGLGATIIEKHFKLDSDKGDIGDKPLSANELELKKLVDLGKYYFKQSLGEPVFKAKLSESWNQLVRKAHAKYNLKKGEKLTLENCEFLISGKGEFTSFDILNNEIILLNEVKKGNSIITTDIIRKD
tara:strand:+ start:39 stop:908 length:870 start_codon:yes stop_codon:yes gene_type:complete